MAPLKQRKIAVMGSRSVGKSSLAIQFAQVNIHIQDMVLWTEQYKNMFLGSVRWLVWSNNRKYIQQEHEDSGSGIWSPGCWYSRFDWKNCSRIIIQYTSGQDEYSIFPTQYTVDIDGYVLVYSIDNEKSFEVVQSIYEKLVDLVGTPSFPLVIVGNKSDLHINRVISETTGKKLAQDLKAMFFETSAKDNHCATDLFTKTIIQIEKVKYFCIQLLFF